MHFDISELQFVMKCKDSLWPQAFFREFEGVSNCVFNEMHLIGDTLMLLFPSLRNDMCLVLEGIISYRRIS